MYHKECNGGEITVNEITGFKYYKDGGPTDFLAIYCNSCKKRIWIEEYQDPKEKIIKTAIDGQKRKITVIGWEGNIFPGYNPKKLQKEIKDEVLDWPFRKYHDRSVDYLLKKSFKNPDSYIYVIQKDSEDFYCPFCGSQFIPIAAYCPNCGTEVEERIGEIKEASVKK